LTQTPGRFYNTRKIAGRGEKKEKRAGRPPLFLSEGEEKRREEDF